MHSIAKLSGKKEGCFLYESKKILVRVFTMVVALLLVLNMGGITARAKSRSTIVVWAWGPYITAAHEAINIYRNNVTPYVDFEVHEYPSASEMEDKLKMTLATNTDIPDIAIINDDSIASYYEEFPNTFAQCGVRYSSEPAALYYNKHVMEEIGVEMPDNLTWDRFREIGLMLKNSYPDKYLFAGDDTLSELLLRSADITDIELTSAEILEFTTKEALEMLKEFGDDGLIYEGEHPDIVGMLSSGYLFSVIGGPWWVPTISQIANEQGQEWLVAKIPTSNTFWKDVELGGYSWMVFENGNEVKAVNFLASTFETDTQLAVKMAESNLIVPILYSVHDDLEDLAAETYFSGSAPHQSDQNGQHVIEFLFDIFGGRFAAFCNHEHGGSGSCACNGFRGEVSREDPGHKNLPNEAFDFLKQLLKEVLRGEITPQQAAERFLELLRENGYYDLR